jgi:hypothetical protein
MTVHKSPAWLHTADGALIGEGRAYLHLRLPPTEPQTVQGTLSLEWWNDELRTQDARLALEDGPTLLLRLETDRLSSCMVGRILRYQVDWPGLVS